jgi:Domain of unknown function (DUF4838)
MRSSKIQAWMILALFAATVVRCGALPVALGDASKSTVLVEDGKPVCSIVIAKEATRSAQFAAFELQYHIQKITGAKVPIVDEEAKNSGTKILVGDSKLAADLRIDGTALGRQEYILRFLDDTIVLLGRDKADYGKVDYESPIALGCSAGQVVSTGTFPGFFEDHATCYAVYDFLEDYCGVRWYLPTQLGEAYTPLKTLTVSGKNVRRAPAMKYRWLVVVPIPEDLCGDTVGDKAPPPLPWRDDLLWLHRSRAGGEAYDCNHSLDGYYDRFLASHSGWFAQGYEGKPPNLCYTNPELIEQVVTDARDYFDGKGLKPGASAAGDYFAVVPMDGAGWCKCPRCAEALKDGDSNYFYTFVNTIAKEVRMTHPDKFISALAYSNYIDPPTKVNVEPNISIQMCLHTRGVAQAVSLEHETKALANWSAESKDRQKFIWAYFCFPSAATLGQFRGFPGFFAHYLPTKMAAYQKAGATGIFFEPAYLNFGTRSVLLDQVEWYVTMRLADDPTLDGGKLIDEFFVMYYGAAAKPMSELYTRIEETFADKANYGPNPQSMYSELQTEETAWKYLGTDARMAEFGELMEQAKSLAQTEIEKQRVALFEKGIWKFMKAGKQSYQDK